ncbi:uncharacterized protein LOC135376504 [Ornithodoros turicata]|uniref:uncharacterized protein LOC135376504 n=1 Tax=Ornithodoros turicata TaxID=34597 RepID=UPI0031389B4D
MEELKRRRGGLRSALSRSINGALDKLTEADLQEEEIEVLTAQLKKKLEKLEAVDAELEVLWTEQELEAEQQESFEYSDRATALLARLQFRVQRLNSVASLRGSHRSEERPVGDSTASGLQIRLPKLNLVKFNGQRKDRMAFWEQFRQVIHDNGRLSVCEKFSYLRSALTGEAAAAISGLPPTERCYNDALEILKGRYGNEALQIEDHMTRLMGLQPVRSHQDAKGLRKLHDELSSHTRALKALGVSEESFSSMLYSLMLRLIPQGIVVEFNRRMLEAEDGSPEEGGSREEASNGQGDRENPSPSSGEHVAKLRKFVKFLRVEVECLERTLTAQGTRKDTGDGFPKMKGARKQRTKGSARLSSAAALVNTTDQLSDCFFCNSRDHRTTECDARMSQDDKLRRLQEAGRCFRCTWPNHVSRKCWRKVKCGKCQGRHAASVCNHRRGDEEVIQDRAADGTTQLSLELLNEDYAPTTVLQTTVAWCKGEKEQRKCKVMFDTGSQRSFLTKQIAQTLHCRTVGEETVKVGVFGGQEEERLYRRVRLRLQSIYNESEYDLEVLVTDTICTQRTPRPGSGILDQMKERQLAVQHLTCAESQRPVQVLIGTDVYWDLVTGEVIRLGRALRAVETRLGWTVHGATSEAGRSHESNQALVLRVSANQEQQDNYVQKFWQLEAIGVAPETEKSESDSALRRFGETVTLNEGRYEVSLPYKAVGNLDSNEEIALKRLGQLTRKLSKNQELMNRYDEAIRMYSQNNMAERVPAKSGEIVYYMPHQAVLRETSSTTKLRVVFDCSSSNGSTKSLNDCLEVGPNLNPDVVELMINFRINKVALVADVEKAFLQIQVKEDDRDALRYLWYEGKPQKGSPLPKVEHWRMTRVPFGTTASPFLLAATLRHHFKVMEQEYPDTAKMLGKHMYVDDLVTGANDAKEAIKIAKDSTEILQRANMKLHKWASNDKSVLEFLRGETEERKIGESDEIQKVLGLSWLPETDMLTFSVDGVWNMYQATGATKRLVLRITARIFDPLGMLAPFTIRGKAIFQELWKLKVGWDDALPAQSQVSWSQWGSELSHLQEVQLPRYYGANGVAGVRHIEIHIFCDASPTAYGAVAYTVMEDKSGTRSSAFLIAKTRLAPLKAQTIPRLELMACLVGGRLFAYLKAKFEACPTQIHFWTDSKIALCWIQGDANRWKQFVQNRVREIQDITNSAEWRYCNTKENPADMLTRGITADKLIDSQRWWTGPNWILCDQRQWPTSSMDREKFGKVELEEKVSQDVIQTLTATVGEIVDMKRYSSVKKLHHVVAWVLRFVAKLKKRSEEGGPLGSEEVRQAENYCLKIVQQNAFHAEIAAVQSQRPSPAKSPLQGYSLFLDGEGILRMTGRLQESDLPYAQKHPIVLPKQDPYSEAIIRKCHLDVLHGGMRDTLVQVREKYWIVRARQAVKKVIRSCVVCQRYNAQASRQTPAPLPASRVSQSEPFTVTGLDFAGPLIVRTSRSTRQIYFVIFV